MLSKSLAALALGLPFVPWMSYAQPAYGSSVSPARWYTSEQIVITNIISIQENKAAMDKELKLLNEFLDNVYKKEPGCEFFALNRDDGHFQYVTYEIYKNQAAVDIHLNTDYMKALLKAEQDQSLKRADNDVHHEVLVSQIGPRYLK